MFTVDPAILRAQLADAAQRRLERAPPRPTPPAQRRQLARRHTAPQPQPHIFTPRAPIGPSIVLPPIDALASAIAQANAELGRGAGTLPPAPPSSVQIVPSRPPRSEPRPRRWVWNRADGYDRRLTPFQRAAVLHEVLQRNRDARAAGQYRAPFPPSAVRVLATLLNGFQSDATGAMFPAHRTIAEILDYHRSTVAEAMRLLEQRVVITWIHRFVLRRVLRPDPETGEDVVIVEAFQTSNQYRVIFRTKNPTPETMNKNHFLSSYGGSASGGNASRNTPPATFDRWDVAHDRLEQLLHRWSRAFPRPT